METQPIYVNGKPFLGRVEEQKQFRAALQEVLNQGNEETLPYVFLLYGDGGIGKTTLGRRFRDIANDEAPFHDEFQIFWVDWEEEKKRLPALQVERESISPETVFDVMFTVAQRNEWEKYFTAYKTALEERKTAEKQAAEAIVGESEKDEFVLLRSVSATAFAKILRIGMPVIGDSGEKLAQSFLEVGIKVGAEQAAYLRGRIEANLRAKMGVKQFELYLNPNEGLARALADGFKRLADTKPLLVFLDTYEIIDRTDIWVRMMLQTAGGNLAWIIGGRNNLLNSRKFGKEYLRGYSEDFPRRLIPYDMRQLALEDVRKYFETSVPDRPLDENMAEAIRQATHGIPLAIEQAAEMWKNNLAIEKIIGDSSDATPSREIVSQMTDRYLLHAVKSEDKIALYAIALANGDLDGLRAMLKNALGKSTNLDEYLKRLERDYASVYSSENRLHDEPALFILTYLKQPILRTSDEIIQLNQVAVETLQARLNKLEEELFLLEERCQDEDWVKVALRLGYHIFWLDETKGWKWFIPRYIESLAYSNDLRHGLIALVGEWEKELSSRGQKRLTAIKVFEADDISAAAPLNDLLIELDNIIRMGWIDDGFKNERLAILNWLRGRLCVRNKNRLEAIKYYELTENELPEEGRILREKLGQSLSYLARELIWFSSDRGAAYSGEAEKILLKIIHWLPNDQDVWYRLAVNYEMGKNFEEAIITYQKAIDLNPKTAFPWTALGNGYAKMKQYDKAINAYEKAVELDPKYARAWTGLGSLFRDLKQTDQAFKAYNKAIEIDPDNINIWNNLGLFYSSLRRYDEAIDSFQKAIGLDSTYVFPWVNLGYVYFRSKQYDQAIISYRKALDLSNVNGMSSNAHAIAWCNLGNVYVVLKQYDNAIKAYNESLTLDAKYIRPYRNLGPLYENLNKLEQAIELYKRAINVLKSDHELSDIWSVIGRTHLKQNNLESAITAYKESIKLNPEDWYSRAYYAKVLILTNQSDEAENQIEMARVLIKDDDIYASACFEALRGNAEEAFKLLKQAIEEGQDVEWIKQDPDWESLRDDPRFKALVGEG